MKKYLLLLLLLPFISGCDSDDYSNNNPYLPNYNFSIDLDLNLPLYTELQFPSNPVVINQAGIGINGVIVMNTGNNFVAFENSCPNQELSNCSILELDGIIAICPCDNAEYNLYSNGQAQGKKYPLKPYRVEILSQTAIRIYN